jgi:Flp pilus assembly protein TadB
MLAPEDTSCTRCGRAVGAGTHLRWYFSSAAGSAVVTALLAHSLLRLSLASVAVFGAVGAAIGVLGAWSLRRSRLAR